MRVADILARKRATKTTIAPDATIGALAQLLKERRVGAAVVSGDGQSIDGVITERDITYGIATHGAALHGLPVSALMTKNVITCTTTDHVGLVASTMLSRNVRHIPVEQDGRLMGMVSIRDVLHFRVDELQQQTAQFRTIVDQMAQPQQDRE